jgi:hypothetical protein
MNILKRIKYNFITMPLKITSMAVIAGVFFVNAVCAESSIDIFGNEKNLRPLAAREAKRGIPLQEIRPGDVLYLSDSYSVLVIVSIKGGMVTYDCIDAHGAVSRSNKTSADLLKMRPFVLEPQKRRRIRIRYMNKTLFIDAGLVRRLAGYGINAINLTLDALDNFIGLASRSLEQFGRLRSGTLIKFDLSEKDFSRIAGEAGLGLKDHYTGMIQQCLVAACNPGSPMHKHLNGNGRGLRAAAASI